LHFTGRHIWCSSSASKKMKLFLIATLVACAFAEPEADAYYSNVYGYPGYSLGSYGYSSYAISPYTSYGTAYGYGYPYTYGSYSRLVKRDADAEPKADAYYAGYYGYPSYGYSSYALSPYTTYGTTYRYSGYPFSYGSYSRLVKRDAEPEADAFYGNVYGYTGYGLGSYGYSNYALSSPYAYGSAYGYGYPYTYGSYSHLVKRDADAKPKADAYYAGYYGYPGYAYKGYRSYGYPFTYGYPAYSRYYY